MQHVLAGLALVFTLGLAPAWAQTPKVRYESAIQRETTVRPALEQDGNPSAPARTALLTRVTRLVASYEAIPRRYPTSSYADNALWQAGGLMETMFRRFGRPDDRAKALRLYAWLIREYPSSPLVRRTRTQSGALEDTRSVDAAMPPAPAAPAAPERTPAASRPASIPPRSVPVPTMTSASAPPPPVISSGERAMVSGIQRSVLPGSVRVTLELDREVPYYEERITSPDRVFFDLKGAQLAAPLVDKVISYSDDIVRQIRTGRHRDNTVRVVLDLEGVSRYSVFTLYNPYRLVIDCERSTAVPVRLATVTPPTVIAEEILAAPVPEPTIPTPTVPVRIAEAPAAVTPDNPPAPVVPSSNTAGGFSLSRQLGLSVSRIVIDPGHGGHDPGANVRGLHEADLTLDVALRLEKLLANESGIEVVLTRRTNVYVPLEERTAIANRESADLFLSIHANASRNPNARGIETYYLSFASSPEAEAVAARENSASERAMHNLPDIIKAIALNNKLDESKDLASMVQETMVTHLRKSNQNARNLGVKKAPFVVLIGAGMPSVLAEIAFLTNKQEAQLLKTSAYKQRIAESLRDAVMKYRRSLKRQSAVADRP